MRYEINLKEAVLNTWKTNNRTTVFLVEHLPAMLWNEKLPGQPRRTIGMIANHIHNSRCSWIKSIGKNQAVKTPARVDLYRSGRDEVVGALSRSSEAMLKLFSASIDNGGRLPSKPAWLNFPNDIIHFIAYFVAHEAHHRGQIILLARQLNHRLPREVTDGVWQWNTRLREEK